MESCPVHGEDRAVLIEQRDTARTERDRARRWAVHLEQECARLRELVADAIDAGASNTPADIARIRREAGLDGAS